MKVLHLFSNWKWTGPAEPAVNLCKALSSSHEVEFICGSPPEKRLKNQIVRFSEERGVHPIEGFRLNKHFHLIDNIRDCMRLRRVLAQSAFDLIHVHLDNDHFLAGFAGKSLKNRPPVVRSFYGTLGPEPGFRTALLLKRFTAGAIVISEAARRKLIGKRGFPENRCVSVPVGVDTKRFDPGRVDREAAKKRFGFDREDIVLGIVARMQRHRKFELLLEALRQAMEKEPLLKFLIVGRGTHTHEVAVKPVREMGLEKRILFAGYLQGDDFINALGAMDAAMFLVPGSDGSCRAVREKMAMGLPVIAVDTPPLNEMILPGKTGYLVESSVNGIRDAVMKAAENREGTEAMGRAAREYARQEFSLDKQAARVEAFYRRLIGERN